METMKVERFVELFDTKVQAARAIGIKPNTLTNWLARTPGEYEVTVGKSRREVIKVMRVVKV